MGLTIILIVITVLAAVGSISRAADVWREGYSALWVVYSAAFGIGLLAVALRLAGLI